LGREHQGLGDVKSPREEGLRGGSARDRHSEGGRGRERDMGRARERKTQTTRGGGEGQRGVASDRGERASERDRERERERETERLLDRVRQTLERGGKLRVDTPAREGGGETERTGVAGGGVVGGGGREGGRYGDPRYHSLWWQREKEREREREKERERMRQGEERDEQERERAGGAGSMRDMGVGGTGVSVSSSSALVLTPKIDAKRHILYDDRTVGVRGGWGLDVSVVGSDSGA
jgi:zinc finger CCCH domain-containing protein 13